MDFEKLEAIVRGIKYDKPGIQNGFNVITGNKYGKLLFLQHYQHVLDVKTGEAIVQRGRKWYISPYMTASEVVQTALLAVKQFEEHEIRENFFYHNKRVFGPHLDVRALQIVADQEEIRE